MKRVWYLAIITVLLVSLAACGSSDDGGDTGGDNGSSGAVEPKATNTPIVLATPTPKPAPPTPTPKPTSTPLPTPEPTEESAATTEEATPEPTLTPTPDPIALLGTEMVEVPAGPFTLGSGTSGPEDGPAQTVELAAFAIDKFEVTNDDFNVFVEATGYETYAEQTGSQNWRKYAEGQGGHPVVKVTWNDAVAFCEWAGKRLPTEMEWEKAARGTDGRTYPWGNEFDPSAGLCRDDPTQCVANVKETALRNTTAAGSFPGGASPYGAEDMGGNVWEWTSSWFQSYEGSTADNPYFGERFRVTRGGAWFEEPAQVATYNRNAADPEITANDDLGFRCVVDLQ